MISILCPTRGRPKILQRMIDSVRDTAKNQHEIVLYIDDDDHSYDEMNYELPRKGTSEPIVWSLHGPRITMSDMWNELIPYAKGDVFMLCGDDCVFKTPDWDLQVEGVYEKSPDKLWLCYGDDLGPGGKVFATHPFVHRRWVEIIGYFSGPGFSCDYADAWPQDVADMIGRKRRLDFVNEHLHALWGKAEFDQTYRDSAARMARDNPPKRYEETFPLRKADADKLRPHLNTPWVPIRHIPAEQAVI